MMKRCLLILSLAFAAVLIGCSRSLTAEPTPVVTAPPPSTGPGFSGGGVVASGEIAPARQSDVSFSVSGRVATVAVARGDEVEPGAVLVTLETDLLEARVRAAEAALVTAQADLALVKAGPRPEEVAVAEAHVEAAEGALAEAAARRDQLTAGATEAEVAAARAQLSAAEADWMIARITHDQLKDREGIEDWEKEEALLRKRAAELNLAAAEADLEAARAALDQAMLRAPFDGTVTALEVSLGEVVMPGQAALTVADLRHLRVETTDLSERDVDRVAAGQRATVYVEALGVEIAGHVVEIPPSANVIGGDVVYAVVIALDEQPPELRWGMSVEVEIAVE